MADVFSKEMRSRTMRAVRSVSELENKVSKALWHRGLRFRKNVRSLTGTPDIAIKKYRIVIFVDSCFWHGCSEHCRIPSSNQKYWINKIQRNIERDEKVNEYYTSIGWEVIRIWEHDLRTDFNGTIDSIIDIINSVKRICNID
ncbi:MAG: very short patch repair endonuclease [Alicyclobacillus herbarius]|uniref:very short patch repair endonuclease n=1 Tax=Alicyclobacillus herbarius TaxID=122960 RepID=UPI002352B237|nr:very short patch repair endonuclease [Alicyclobacillus herbarius]MCL6633110.1 very short patch repair endonuclease [Alicyclobacillus herbarius]